MNQTERLALGGREVEKFGRRGHQVLVPCWLTIAEIPFAIRFDIILESKTIRKQSKLFESRLPDQDEQVREASSSRYR